MNYAETLDYLYNTLPMFSRMGSAAFKKDLTNIQALCAHLGHPQQRFQSIHVGGTNGKGSVSHMLAATLQTAGYKTGLYTSPHLKDFRERIRVDGQMANEAFVVDFIENHKAFIESIQPSFFEITVAMAFEYFAQQQVEVAVVEVGLGGRLDSTNIVQPVLSVITNIGWDHMNLLGNTLEAIAGEKAGIIKPNTPVVVGEKQPATEPIFRQVAQQKEAPLLFAEDRFQLMDYQLAADRLVLQVQDKEQDQTKTYQLDLPGIYQTKNILTVLQSIEVLKQKHFSISEQQVQTAFQQTKKITGLSGRWEVVHQAPAVVLEVAHNEDGMRQMLAHLAALHYQQLHIILGMVKDKEVEKVLALLPTQAHYYFTQAHIPRALEATALQAKAAVFHLQGQVYQEVNQALQEALQQAAPEDMIVVCGSIFLVAEVEHHL